MKAASVYEDRFALAPTVLRMWRRGHGCHSRLRINFCWRPCPRFAIRFDRRSRRYGLRFSLRLTDRADHVETTLRVVLEFVVQDSLAAVQRVLEADEFSGQAGELFSREKRLREKSLQQAGAHNHFAILRRKLLQTEHGDDVLEFAVLRERAADFLREGVMPFANDARRGHLGTGL